MLRELKRAGVRFVFAHRQSSESRGKRPGPDLWAGVGQWAIGSGSLTVDRLRHRSGLTVQPLTTRWRRDCWPEYASRRNLGLVIENTSSGTSSGSGARISDLEQR